MSCWSGVEHTELFAPETSVFAQLSHLFMSQISIREPRVKST
jgi:hypothetical protein